MPFRVSFLVASAGSCTKDVEEGHAREQERSGCTTSRSMFVPNAPCRLFALRGLSVPHYSAAQSPFVECEQQLRGLICHIRRYEYCPVCTYSTRILLVTRPDVGVH